MFAEVFFRFIPVGTGNTLFNNIPYCSAAVHPRGHGEHCFRDNVGANVGGSSPWARGTQRLGAEDVSPARFIPVGTGNTIEQQRDIFHASVHPRGHGEHFLLGNGQIGLGGSSPWARGTHPYKGFTRYSVRFIPVGTGNTRFGRRCSLCITVHPRGHGEHVFRTVLDSHLPGSSPWARGTHSHCAGWLLSCRFIPVGTGNTVFRTVSDSHLPGSSPWARGTRALDRYRVLSYRFIPVGTGNTR